MKKEEVNLKHYLDGLIECLSRIEDAQKDGRPEKVSQWFQYLQGYIKALDLITKK